MITMSVRRHVRALEAAVRDVDSTGLPRIGAAARRLNEATLLLADPSPLAAAVTEFGIAAELWAAGVTSRVPADTALKTVTHERQKLMSVGAEITY